VKRPTLHLEAGDVGDRFSKEHDGVRLQRFGVEDDGGGRHLRRGGVTPFRGHDNVRVESRRRSVVRRLLARGGAGRGGKKKEKTEGDGGIDAEMHDVVGRSPVFERHTILEHPNPTGNRAAGRDQTASRRQTSGDAPPGY
jgi:hypothetical protein